MLVIEGLEKRYGRKEILRGIDLSIHEPGIHAVLGPNGSGKTTIMKSVLGMVIPNKGKILFNGVNIKNNIEYRKNIDYVPQIAHYPQNIILQEMYRLIEDIRGMKPRRKDELIALFKLEAHLDKRIGALSGGTLQKLNLSLAMMFDSPFLILDEPTTGLDPVAMIALKSMLLEEVKRGKIILLTTHMIDFVETMANRITFLLDGQIYYNGTLSELKHQYGDQNMEQVIAQILTDHV
jgi:Cu-processing system ATP-binding protein